MKLLLQTLSLFSVLFVATAPGFATVTVTSPYSGSTVNSPFTLTASATACSNQPITFMGYSIDTGSTTITSGAYLQATVSSATGGHTLHVKSWGKSGAVCVTDVPVTVSGATVSNPSVSAPTNGSTVTSPFNVSATSSSCNGQPVGAMGYSFDSGSTTVVKGTTLNASVSIGTGGHTLHVKSWGTGGAGCDNPVAVTVSSTSGSTPPSSTSVNNVQALSSWNHMHDAGTTGSSSGSMSLVSSPSRSGAARHFVTNYSNYGGERYAVSFSDDVTTKNLSYDAWVYIEGSAAGVRVLEMDMNQVLANGWTVIYGFQCNGWNGTWDYASNKGTVANSQAHWNHTSAKCNPQQWTPNTWHHVQISYSRDDAGYVTYKSVTFDGATTNINSTVLSAFALGWGRTMLTNFQVDGATSSAGSSSIYLDDLTISRW